MRILCVNVSLDHALREAGHEVLSLALGGGVHALREAAPALETFAPHAIVQQEHLGYAVLLSDLPSFACPKLFWSVDTHINLYWQRYYGRLFDVFCTPHKALCAAAPARWRHPYLCRLPAAGVERDWQPHAGRRHALSFVGRVTEARRTRRFFLECLHERYGLRAQDGLSFDEMLGLYADTRILPNESIALETNFRLLEGASCGCCVISPDIGEDQDVLLTPGREVLIYTDALECLDLMDFCLRKASMAEKIGHLAQQRIQAEHLPRHRAACLLRALEDAPQTALRGAQAQEYLWCSLAELQLNSDVSGIFAPPLHKENLPPWAESPDALVLRLRGAVQWQDEAQCTALFRTAGQILPTCADAARRTAGAEAATALGLVSLRRGDLALARTFWRIFQVHTGKILPDAPAEEDLSLPNMSLPHMSLENLALHWGQALWSAEESPDNHWYQAMDMLSLASRLNPLDSAWARAFMALRPMMRHFPLLALSAAARLSLNAPNDPQASAACIAANVRAFRLRAAQEEAQQALQAYVAPTIGSNVGSAAASFQQALRQQGITAAKLLEALQPFSF